MQRVIPSRAIDARRRQRDGGYLLLAILLMMALMIIAATVEAPRIVQQLKRDREEEMIHRGTEYARAIKKFYKKFGRYPTSLEQLDNTNQIRFLRQRYKDPLAKDGKWTLLHYGDIQALSNPTRPERLRLRWAHRDKAVHRAPFPLQHRLLPQRRIVSARTEAPAPPRQVQHKVRRLLTVQVRTEAQEVRP